MSAVKFASLCDLCLDRSEEYSRWPSCAYCMNDLCPECAFGKCPDSDDGRHHTDD